MRKLKFSSYRAHAKNANAENVYAHDTHGETEYSRNLMVSSFLYAGKCF